MNLNLLEIWEKTLNLIKSELTEVSFNTWLKSLEPISLNGDTITIGVPNEFNKGILETRYKLLIINALKQVTSKEYYIEFVVPSNQITKSSIHNNNLGNQGKESSHFERANLNPKYVFDTFVIGNSNRV